MRPALTGERRCTLVVHFLRPPVGANGSAMREGFQKLYAVEWVACTLWILVWGILGYIALTERSITLGGGKSGLGSDHFDGAAAVAVGLVMLGMAAGGVGWLFRPSRYRLLLRSILFVVFLGGAILYVVLFTS